MNKIKNINNSFMSDYSFISQNDIFNNKNFNGFIHKTNTGGLGYELLNLKNKIKGFMNNVFYIKDTSKLYFERYIIEYKNINDDFEKYLLNYNTLETNILSNFDELKAKNLFTFDMIYYNFFFSDKIEELNTFLSENNVNIYKTNLFYLQGGRIDNKNYYDNKEKNNKKNIINNSNGLLYLNEILTQYDFFIKLLNLLNNKENILTNKLKNIKLVLTQYFNIFLENLIDILNNSKNLYFANNIYLDLSKIEQKDIEYQKKFYHFYYEKLSSYFKKDFEIISKELNALNLLKEFNSITYGFRYLGKDVSFKDFQININELSKIKDNKLEGINYELLNEINNRIQKLDTLPKDNEEIKYCQVPTKVYFPEYKIKRLGNFLFDNEKEKQDFLKLYEENKDLFADEDDYILRYFSYKGFIDRILSFSDNKKAQKLKLSDFIVFIKANKRYLEYYKELEEKIKQKELNISDVKENILDYLTEEQKEFLEKYGNIEINYDLYNKKYLTLKDYIQQIEYEYVTISYLGFSGYFNIVMDFILWGKKNNIGFGPGRGSAGGVLISYLLGIIDVNPLRYGLLFERMLHLYKAKGDFPDIDVDIEADGRIKVWEYLKYKYGKENVAHIGSFMNSKTKSEFKRLTKNSGIPFQEINDISKIFSDNEKENKKILEEIINYYTEGEGLENINDTIKDLLDKYKNTLSAVFNLLKEFLGRPTALGVHACGIIIASVPVETLCSCRPSNDSPLKVAFGDKIETEKLGFIKFDLLGLVNVSIIKQTIKTIMWQNEKIRKKYNIKIKDFSNIEWDNIDWQKMYYDILNKIGSEKGSKNYEEEISVYDIFQKGLTKGVFQFESEGMKKILKQVKANNILELSDINAMYRPGPLANIPTYVETKFGRIKDIFPKELLKDLEKKYGKEKVNKSKIFLEKIILDVTAKTKNLLVYQEQIMFLFYKLGLPYDEADKVRKIFSKITSGKYTIEDAKTYIEKAKKVFKEHGYLTELFDWYIEKVILPFSEYAFNFSHAFAYCLIAYITGYLKKYFPTEFYASLLKYRNTPENIADTTSELGLMGLELLSPDLEKSLKYPIVYNE